MLMTFDKPLDNPFDPSKYAVRLISLKDPTYIRKAIVKGLEDPNTLKLRFLGAYSGKYQVKITHSDLGHIDTSFVPIVDVNGYMKSISPLTGSPYGGTILTITGGPFSFNGLENNVKIGRTDCFVLTSTPTQITC